IRLPDRVLPDHIRAGQTILHRSVTPGCVCLRQPYPGLFVLNSYGVLLRIPLSNYFVSCFCRPHCIDAFSIPVHTSNNERQFVLRNSYFPTRQYDPLRFIVPAMSSYSYFVPRNSYFVIPPRRHDPVRFINPIMNSDSYFVLRTSYFSSSRFTLSITSSNSYFN